MKRVEQFEAIRRDRRVENLSIRELAKRHQVHRRTVRDALASAEPPARKAPERSSPATDPWRNIIVEWLTADLEMPKKQRHTARRVWQRLIDEHGAIVSEPRVRVVVAQIRKELRNDVSKVPIVQQHEPGDEAEVDFGDVYAVVDGVQLRLYMFAMRLSASGRGFHRIYATCAQEAFLDGHVRSFERFGGVPHRIRYDNLKSAVTRVLMGRNRDESERFTLLRSHYGFDSFFCIPGVEGAHEKGGIEGDIGRFRRNHLVPLPAIATIAELNELVQAGDDKDDLRHIDGRHSTVIEDFANEEKALSLLPVERFDPSVHLRARVDAKARVRVRTCNYSVPVRFVDKTVDVLLGATSLDIRFGRNTIATHERQTKKNAEVLCLDHYLETLITKPGAVAGSTALDQARKQGAFTKTHDAFWQQARQKLGDGPGTKALIEILLLGRHVPRDALVLAMKTVLSTGSVDPALVAIEARKHNDNTTAPVIPIQFGAGRPAPDITNYDQLLGDTK